jgi:hypothetical protein
MARIYSFALTWIVSWANNCAANDLTNGVDLKSVTRVLLSQQKKRSPRGVFIDKSMSNTSAISTRLVPTLPTVGESSAVIKSFMLDKTTAVVGCTVPLGAAHD